jgi:hypothetical protein
MSAFSAILEQFFQLEEHNSDVVTELRAGEVTFFTSSYIIFVQHCGWYGTGVYILSTDQTVLR